jgi:hypothetical protein
MPLDNTYYVENLHAVNLYVTGNVTLPNGSITQAEVSNGYVDLSSTQTVGGAKTLTGLLTGVAATFTGRLTVTGSGGINPQWFNALDYGAVADGATNDALAIANAITACKNAGGGNVYLPRGAAGNYRLALAVPAVTTTAITSPATGGSYTVSLNAAVPYGYYFISDGVHAAYGCVTAGGGSTTITFLVSNDGSAGTIAIGAQLYLLGLLMMPGVSFITEPSVTLSGNRFRTIRLQLRWRTLRNRAYHLVRCRCWNSDASVNGWRRGHASRLKLVCGLYGERNCVLRTRRA